MSRNATLAVRITEKSLDIIAVVNGGVTPELEDEVTYYVIENNGTPDETQEILSETDFRSRYALMHMPVQDDAFVHVRKIATS